MRAFVTLLLAFVSLSLYGNNPTFNCLAEVNKCWHEQNDISPDLFPTSPPRSAHAVIQLHLSLVETILRQRSTDHLSDQQRENRAACLDLLHQYWQAGRFPINEDYTCRTPIFIDRRDNFCAVGYLVKRSGHEATARKIAAATNLAYVREMHFPELNIWAHDHGFTIDELAWVQPTYGSTTIVVTDSLGGGVDGTVNELYADNAAGRLYVGGDFTNADRSVPCNNIAYATRSGTSFTWHSMASGLNGTVNAIAGFSGRIFVGGRFTTAGSVLVSNVASWDGASWCAAGCLAGDVRKLIVYDDELYAAGDFEVCGGTADVNFAKWDGTKWIEILGLSGHVNTMEVATGTLVLGGDVTYAGERVNAIKWTNAGGFQKFANKLSNEVKDLKVYGDTLYAACRRTHASDTLTLLMKLRADAWSPTSLDIYAPSFSAPYSGISFNSLCPESGQLNIGGDFVFNSSVGRFALNCFNVTHLSVIFGYWITVDSAINKMVLFDGDLIAGGRFRHGFYASRSVDLNGICRRVYRTSQAPTFSLGVSSKIYPNPVAAGSQITIQNATKATSYSMRDVSGKLIAEGPLHGTASEQILTPKATPGSYILEVINEGHPSETHKILIK